MKKINAFILVIFLSFNTYSSNTNDEVVKLHDRKGKLGKIIYDICCSVRMPVLVESEIPYKKEITLSRKTGKLKEILSEICEQLKNHKYSINNDVIQIQQKSLIEAKDYPLDKYKFSQDIETDNLKDWETSESFLNELLFNRIIHAYSYVFDENEKRPYKKEYSKMTVREVIIDLLKATRTWCWINKMSDKGKQKYIEIYKTKAPLLYNKIKDVSEPFYALSWLHGYGVLEDIANEKERILSKYHTEDGTTLLKANIKVSENNESIIVDIENISDQKLVFKNFKKDGLLILGDLFWHKKKENHYENFLIYPPEESNLQESFSLSPGEKKEFSISLENARCRFYDGLESWIITCEIEKGDKDYFVDYFSDYEKNNPIKKLPYLHGENYFRAIVYFYDDKGIKYKSSSKEISHGFK